MVRPLDVRTPMAAIFRGPPVPDPVASTASSSPTQTPGKPGSRPTSAGRNAEGDQRVDDHLLHLMDVPGAPMEPGSHD